MQSESSSQDSPSARSGWQVPSQWYATWHSPSVVHDAAHCGSTWFGWPVQNTGTKGEQSFAWTLVPQPESSSIGADVPQAFAVQVASRRVPWQRVVSVQLGAWGQVAGQSAATAQQSPPVQQNPFWQ